MLERLRTVEVARRLPELAGGQFVQASRRVRVPADEKDQSGRLGFGFARPCSHFSSVRSLIRSLRANTAREQRSFLRVSRRNFESTLGSGATSTLQVRKVSLPSRWLFIVATPAISSPKMSRFAIIVSSAWWALRG
jgi:hypothetical protein